MMSVHQAELVISAVSPSQYPQNALPEIALAGRSNVGKSSFINRMIRRKALARTSSKPGKTQTLNFYKIEDRFYFVDVPGYGYAKVSKTERARWGRFIEEYLQTRERLQAVCLIVDIRHAPSKEDQMMNDYLSYLALPKVIIATKVDKIPKGKVQKQVQMVRQMLNIPPSDPVLPFSAQTGQGQEQAWQFILPYIKNHKSRRIGRRKE